MSLEIDRREFFRRAGKVGLGCGLVLSSLTQVPWGLDQALASATPIPDLDLIFKPALTVLDAYRVLVANGPQGGSLADVQALHTVAAGTDQVAIDSFGATLFGLKGSDLSYLVKAAEMSLGQMDLDKLRIRRLEI